MFNWFKKRPFENPLVVDLHSHLLPGLDDGVQSFDDALTIIRRFQSFGYRKIITTPHITADAYRNSPETILPKLHELRQLLKEQQINIVLEAAAEYYLDDSLMKKLTTNERLMTLGKNYLLFETGFLSEPLFLKEFIFTANTKGYQLILAHPERYIYIQEDFSKAQDLLDRGVLFQINLSSLIGHYSKAAQKTAEKLIKNGNVHFLASDCHTIGHTELMERAFATSYFSKAVSLHLLNNSLL